MRISAVKNISCLKISNCFPKSRHKKSFTLLVSCDNYRRYHTLSDGMLTDHVVEGRRPIARRVLIIVQWFSCVLSESLPDLVNIEVFKPDTQLQQDMSVDGARYAGLTVQVRGNVEPRHFLNKKLEAGTRVELHRGVVRRLETFEKSKDDSRRHVSQHSWQIQVKTTDNEKYSNVNP